MRSQTGSAKRTQSAMPNTLMAEEANYGDASTAAQSMIGWNTFRRIVQHLPPATVRLSQASSMRPFNVCTTAIIRA